MVGHQSSGYAETMDHGEDTVRVVMFVRGRVQRVGFRWWTRSRALELGLVGYAKNLADERVEVCAQGDLSDVEKLCALLKPESAVDSRPGRVEGLTLQSHPPHPDTTGFLER